MQMENQQLWAPETYKVFVSLVANYKMYFLSFLNNIHSRFKIGTDEQVHNSERED